MDTWQAIKTERAALVDGLATLPDTAWDQPSLCSGWSVRDLVAHLISTATLTPPKFFGKLVASGFRFSTMTSREIQRIGSGARPADLVTAFAARVDTRNAPPGPATSWLGETIVHGEDIFRSLGPYRDHPADHLAAVAEFYAGSNLLIGTKSRIEGITLAATDTDWTHGTGPEIRGPLVALVMAMTGRKAALDDLSGDGLDVLRSRP